MSHTIYHVFNRDCLKNEHLFFKVKTKHLEGNAEFIIQYKNGVYGWRFSKDEMNRHGFFQQSVNENGKLEMYLYMPTDILTFLHL